MSEGNVFGQPGDKLMDDLSRTQPAWAKEATGLTPPADSFAGAGPKIGDAEKMGNEGEKIPTDDFAAKLGEYRRLVAQREGLIAEGVPEHILIVPTAPRAPANFIQPKDWKDERFPVDEADLMALTSPEEAMKLANPLLRLTPKNEILSENDLARAAADMPLSHMEASVGVDLGFEEAGVTREKIDGMSREQIEEVGKPLAEYIYEPRPGTKDSNPKEAFGSRKAGLSTISRQVMYEVGLAMLEGALKYGRHNYRIAGVRASTYYDACGRHMDAWWEGQDIDPDSGAKLHHITKAIAGLTVIRDSMLAGNWTDDRPPSIGDPNWLAWYNEQAAMLVDACKNPKPPFVKGDNE